MSFLLDTDICSAHVRRPAGLAHRFVQHGGRVFVPTLVVAELYAGAYYIRQGKRLLTGIADLLQDVAVLPFDLVCAERFGRVRGTLLRIGRSVPVVDLLIASVALVH